MGKRACWIGASGDQTFVKLSASLISDEQFASSSILASDKYFRMLFIPFLRVNVSFIVIMISSCSTRFESVDSKSSHLQEGRQMPQLLGKRSN